MVAVPGGLLDIDLRHPLDRIELREMRRVELVLGAEAHRLLALRCRDEDRRTPAPVGRGHDADLARIAVRVNLADRARLARDLRRRIADDAGLARIRRLIGFTVERDRVLLPALHDHHEALFEDVAVLAVRIAAVRDGRDRARGLADDVRPARLVAAREADEIFAARDMVDDRGFLRDADRVLRGRDIAERADMRVLHLAGPPGVQHAGVRADLVAFRMQVMLDGREAPHAHLVGGLVDVHPLMQHPLVEIGVTPERTRPLAALLPVGGKHRIELQDDLRLHGRALHGWRLVIGPHIEGRGLCALIISRDILYKSGL